MRVVAHVDMDAFFAAVEERMNPHLAGRPLAVGGDPKQRRGVIAAANYPARKYGLHAGMPTGEALRLLPDVRHEPHNEPVRDRVLAEIAEWIGARAQAPTPFRRAAND